MPKIEVYVVITVNAESERDADILVQSALENMLSEGADIDSFVIEDVMEK